MASSMVNSEDIKEDIMDIDTNVETKKGNVALDLDSTLEFVFKKKKYKILPTIGFQKKIDAANQLVAATVIANYGHGTAYVSSDFQAMYALVSMAFFTTFKVDFAQPPEELYKLYDALSDAGILDTVFNNTSRTMGDVYGIFAYMLDITKGEVKAEFDEKLHKESFGVYAKEFLGALLGEGDFKSIIAESTGLIGGLQEVMRDYKAVGAEREKKSPIASAMKGNIINLHIKKEE